MDKLLSELDVVFRNCQVIIDDYRQFIKEVTSDKNITIHQLAGLQQELKQGCNEILALKKEDIEDLDEDIARYQLTELKKLMELFKGKVREKMNEKNEAKNQVDEDKNEVIEHKINPRLYQKYMDYSSASYNDTLQPIMALMLNNFNRN